MYPTCRYGLSRGGWLLVAAAWLSGCATTESGDGGFLGDLARGVRDAATGELRTRAPQSAVIGATSRVCGPAGDAWCRNMTGSLVSSFSTAFIERLTREDLQQVAEARERSIRTGEPQVWNNPQSGASGTVETRPAESRPATTTALRVEQPVEVTAPIMDAVGQPYVVKASGGVNVRSGPGTQHTAILRMTTGTRFDAIAKLQNANWYLIGQGPIGQGYVHGDLIEPAPIVVAPPPPPAVDESKLKEVQVALAAECYTTSQRVSLADGTSEEASVTSCRTPDGWVQV